MYYPSYYPNLQNMQPMQMQQSQQSMIFSFVKGEQGAISYVVPPNSTALLMDSESNHFWLKSADASGMPFPLRKFAFNEETQQSSNQTMQQFSTPTHESVDMSQYVKRSELDEILKQIKATPVVKEAKSNAKSSARSDGEQ